MSKTNKNKVNRKTFLTAKLTMYDWGWPDQIVYRSQAKTTEKEKGMMMMEQLKEKFGITDKDLANLREKMIDRLRKDHPVKFTRDTSGRIVSPFARKIFKD